MRWIVGRSLLLLAVLTSSATAVANQPISTGANPYRPHLPKQEGNFAIGGYDTVAYFEEGQAVKGREAVKLEFQDAVWRFSSAENLAAFVEDPASYLPEYGGFCTVCLVEQDGLFDANPKFWAIVNGKLYLNYDGRHRTKFRLSSASYIEWADDVWAKLTQPAEIQEDATGESGGATYKIAIFPLTSDSSGGLADTQVASKLRSYIQDEDSLELSYSYFDATPLGAPVISPTEIWPKGAIRHDPDVGSVTRLAEQLGVQGVVTAWIRNAYLQTPDRSEVDLYVKERLTNRRRPFAKSTI